MFFTRRVKCFLLRSVLRVKKDLYYTYGKNKKLRFPNKVGVSYVLMETFIYNIFSEMRWLKRVLDIGGFLGESAIYLAGYNDEVYCYEFSKDNFAYLDENCHSVSNIRYFNAGVTTSDAPYIEYEKGADVDSTIRAVRGSATSEKVDNVNVVQLLQSTEFDGLKLDIEGGEYNILIAIMENNLFTFTKGIIEFHDLHESEKFSFFTSFIEYIQNKGYTYTLLTNEHKVLTLNALDGIKYCNIYVEKRA